MNDTTGRIGRSVIQLVAAGGLTALVGVVSNGLGPVASAGLLAGSAFAVIVAQNLLEDHGLIRPLLKPSPVGQVVDDAGTVIGDVVATSKGLVEGVAGTLIDDVGTIVGAVGTKEEKGDGE